MNYKKFKFNGRTIEWKDMTEEEIEDAKERAMYDSLIQSMKHSATLPFILTSQNLDVWRAYHNMINPKKDENI